MNSADRALRAERSPIWSSGDETDETERVGRRICHYEVVSKIGQGGTGIVYAAVDVRLQRRVALKLLPVSAARSRERRMRFLHEARSAAAVHHLNVATVFEIGESDDTVFAAMELVEGVTLRRHLDEHPRGLPVPEAVDIASQILRALSQAHGAGIVHRDIKPENVMIGRGAIVKVLDFGPRDDVPSPSALVLGTRAYMSPEQVVGCRVDASSDVYAMGVLLHEMLTGERPEKREGVRSQARERVPLALRPVVDRCLRSAFEERYPDAHALLDALSAARCAPRASVARRSSFSWALAFVMAASVLLDPLTASSDVLGGAHRAAAAVLATPRAAAGGSSALPATAGERMPAPLPHEGGVDEP